MHEEVENTLNNLKGTSYSCWLWLITKKSLLLKTGAKGHFNEGVCHWGECTGGACFHPTCTDDEYDIWWMPLQQLSAPTVASLSNACSKRVLRFNYVTDETSHKRQTTHWHTTSTYKTDTHTVCTPLTTQHRHRTVICPSFKKVHLSSTTPQPPLSAVPKNLNNIYAHLLF